MKQSSLFRPTGKSNALKATAGYDARNLESARTILEDPERWGGADAGLVQWARSVVERLGETNGVRARVRSDGSPPGSGQRDSRFQELDAEIAALPPDPDDRRYRRKPSEAGSNGSQVSDEQVHVEEQVQS
jgi:hypothetical protein